MKTLLCASALALAVGGFASAANAALVQWTLTDVKFVDGGTATGSYVFDASTKTFSRVSISTTGTEGSPQASFVTTCDGTNCTAAFPDPEQNIVFVPADNSNLTGKQVLYLNLESAMTDAGGTIPIKPPEVEPEEQPPVELALRSKAFLGVCQDTTCNAEPDNQRMVAYGQVVGRAYVAPVAATAVPTMAPWSLALLSLLLAPLAWRHKRRQQR
nr:IPTL-CTERM sorting domain-containing protein [Comamonas koreensis]